MPSDNETMMSPVSQLTAGDWSNRARKQGRKDKDFLNVVNNLDLRQLASCLPHVLARQIGAKNAVEVGATDVYAISIFVDISGFSNIAAILQVVTKEGAEMLSYHLNAYFAKLLKVVEEHGGDVLEFSGDAMLCGWYEKNKQNVYNSLQCCAVLHEKVGMYTFTIAGILYSMNVHIGGGAGPVSRLVVGGGGSSSYGVFKHLLAGSAVEESGAAANIAITGQTVVSKSILALLDEFGFIYISKMTKNANYKQFIKYDANLTKELKPDHLQDICTQSETDTKQLLSSFMFSTLVYSLASQEPGELRTVSTLFIKFNSITGTLPVPKLLSMTDENLLVVQKYVSKFDGVINKVVMDDKGVICLCLFGIPRHTHEDDADRAVNCSLKLAKQLAGPSAIGISRAKVFCGMLGTEWRREYTVLGDGVNVAARMMQYGYDQAKWETSVMCDSDTVKYYRGGQAYFISHGGVRIKGKSEQVTVYACTLTSPKTNSATDPFKKLFISTDSKPELQSSVSSLGSILTPSSSISSRSTVSALSGRSSSSNVIKKIPYLSDKTKPNSLSSCNGSMSMIDSAADLNEVQESADETVRVVGMREEKAIIMGWVESAKDGRFRAVLPKEITTPREWSTKIGLKALLIKGTPKSGKSTLLAKAQELLGNKNVTPMSFSGRDTSYYSAVRNGVKAMLEGFNVKIDCGGDEQLQNLIPMMHYVVRLEGIPVPDEEHQKLPAEQKIELINEALLALFKRKCGWPFVFLIDDAQDVDNASWGLIFAAVQRGVHCLMTEKCGETMLGPTSRRVSRKSSVHDESLRRDDTESTASVTDIGGMFMERIECNMQDTMMRSELCATVNLVNFDKESVIELVLYCLTATHVDSKLVDMIVDKSGGVPGLVVSITTSLYNAGKIVVLPNGKVVSLSERDVEDVIVPAIPTVESALLCRMDGLTLKIKSVLRVCSVIGYHFQRSVLKFCIMKDDSFESPEQVIASLCETEFIISEGATLSFTRSIDKDIIYKTLLTSERKKLHEIVSSVLVGLNAPSEVICKHFIGCEKFGEALPYAESAKNGAIRNGDFHSALEFMTDVKHCLEGAGDEIWETTSEQRETLAIDQILCAYELGDLNGAAEAAIRELEAVNCPLKEPRLSKIFCCRSKNIILNPRLTQAVSTLFLIFLWQDNYEQCLWLAEIIAENEIDNGGVLHPAIQFLHKRPTSCEPPPVYRNTSLGVLIMFTSWEIEKQLETSALCMLPDMLTITPVIACTVDQALNMSYEESEVGAIPRPSDYHHLLCSLGVYCLLSGEGRAGYEYLKTCKESATAMKDLRWDCYSEILRTALALNFETSVLKLAAVGYVDFNPFMPRREWLSSTESDRLSAAFRISDSNMHDVSLVSLLIGVKCVCLSRVPTPSISGLSELVSGITIPSVKTPLCLFGVLYALQGFLLAIEKLVGQSDLRNPTHYLKQASKLLTELSVPIEIFPFLTPCYHYSAGLYHTVAGNCDAAWRCFKEVGVVSRRLNQRRSLPNIKAMIRMVLAPSVPKQTLREVYSSIMPLKSLNNCGVGELRYIVQKNLLGVVRTVQISSPEVQLLEISEKELAAEYGSDSSEED